MTNAIASAKNRSAIRFAFRVHEGQYRKNTDIPYVTHPLAVAQYATDFGAEPNTVVAAYLHDVVEDCGVTLTDVFNEFGEKVAKLVDAVTWTRKDVPLEHKALEVCEVLETSGVEAFVLKGCDLLDNLCNIIWDVEAQGPEHVKELFGERSEAKIAHYVRLAAMISYEVRYACPELARSLERRANELKELMETNAG